MKGKVRSLGRTLEQVFLGRGEYVISEQLVSVRVIRYYDLTGRQQVVLMFPVVFLEVSKFIYWMRLFWLRLLRRSGFLYTS